VIRPNDPDHLDIGARFLQRDFDIIRLSDGYLVIDTMLISTGPIMQTSRLTFRESYMLEV
jgi:hypothetical protein